jgi:hypothetical protein
MDRSRIRIAQLGEDLPIVEAPYAVLIDADDNDWGDVSHIRAVGNRLLEAGCRYFVCFGRRSEAVHDYLDDLLVEGEWPLVITTFHDDETKEDVVNFFVNCATIDMNGALVLVGCISDWETYF